MATTAPTYNPFYSADTNKQIMASQQQLALAQALQEQGLAPIKTDNRMMGNIASRVSPWEGVAKLADMLGGSYTANQANNNYAKAFTPPDPSAPASDRSPSFMQKIGNMLSGDSADDAPEGQNASSTPVSGPSQLPPVPGASNEPDPLDQYRQLNGMQTPPIDNQRAQMGLPVGSQIMQPSQPQSVASPAAQQPWSPYSAMGQGVMSGDPKAIQNYAGMMLGNPDTSRAGAELISKFAGPSLAGPQAYNEALGKNAAQLAPPSAMPPGVSAPPQASPQVPQGTIAPMNASALQQPTPGGAPMPPPPQGMPVAAPQAIAPQAPNPSSFPTMAAYQAAMDAYKRGAEAQAEVGPAGEKSQAEEQGKNVAENQQQAAAVISNFGAVTQRIAEQHQNTDKASFNAFNTADGNGPQTFYHRAMQDPTSVANTNLEQLRQQGLISQLGPQLQAAGAKPNRLLDGIITGADSIDLSAGKPAVHAQIDGLYKNYIKNMVSENQKLALSGGTPLPLPPITMKTPKGIGTVDPSHVEDALNAGSTFVFPGYGQ